MAIEFIHYSNIIKLLIDIGISNNSTHKFAHRTYTHKHKRLTVHVEETHIASKFSIMEACALVRVERRVYYRWKKKSQQRWLLFMMCLLKLHQHLMLHVSCKLKIYHGNLSCLNLGKVGFLVSKKMQLFH